MITDTPCIVKVVSENTCSYCFYTIILDSYVCSEIWCVEQLFEITMQQFLYIATYRGISMHLLYTCTYVYFRAVATYTDPSTNCTHAL